MRGRKRDEIPAVLARAQGRFRDWRRKRTLGARIPEPLWKLAVKLAIAHGVCRTALALGCHRAAGGDPAIRRFANKRRAPSFGSDRGPHGSIRLVTICRDIRD